MEKLHRFFNNKIFKTFMLLFLVVTLTLVPFDGKIQHAKTAYAAAVVDDLIICIMFAVITVMGVNFSKAYIAEWQEWVDDNSDFISKYFSFQPTINLIKDIIANNPEVNAWAVSMAQKMIDGQIDLFKKGMALINAPKYIYEKIKAYLDEKYSAYGVEYGLATDTTTIGVEGTIVCNGCYVYPKDYVTSCATSETMVTYDINKFKLTRDNESSSYSWYHVLTVNGYDEDTELFSLTLQAIDAYSNYSTKSVTFKNADCSGSIVLGYSDSLTSEGARVNVYVWIGSEKKCQLSGWYMPWANDTEYANALAMASGQTGITLDTDVYENTSAYPQYLNIYDDVSDYEELSYEDIASDTAVSDDAESGIVNSSAQAITWTGYATDCPIDDLKVYLPDAVIGNWTCTWADDTTVATISCTDISTGESLVSISTDVAITWADVVSEIGTVTDVTTQTGTAVGDATLTLPDDSTQIDWKPLQIAGTIICTRFPFCLPWDLYNAFSQFSSNGDKSAPVIEIPIDLSDFGYYEIELDLSIFDDNVVLVVRWSFYLSFIILLIYVTNKLIGRG